MSTETPTERTSETPLDLTTALDPEAQAAFRVRDAEAWLDGPFVYPADRGTLRLHLEAAQRHYETFKRVARERIIERREQEEYLPRLIRYTVLALIEGGMAKTPAAEEAKHDPAVVAQQRIVLNCIAAEGKAQDDLSIARHRLLTLRAPLSGETEDDL